MNAVPVAAPGTTVPGTTAVVINFVVFQAGWFACILGAAHGWPWGGSLVVALIVAGHIACAARPLEELKLVMAALAIGLVWENLLMALGLVDFVSGKSVEHLAPVWILLMWALFAITLNLSLRWLKGRWLLATVMGAVAGPLSYAAGVRMGAAVFLQPFAALAVLSFGWAVLTPALLFLAQRWNGIGKPAASHA